MRTHARAYAVALNKWKAVIIKVCDYYYQYNIDKVAYYIFNYKLKNIY